MIGQGSRRQSLGFQSQDRGQGEKEGRKVEEEEDDPDSVWL